MRRAVQMQRDSRQWACTRRRESVRRCWQAVACACSELTAALLALVRMAERCVPPGRQISAIAVCALVYVVSRRKPASRSSISLCVAPKMHSRSSHPLSIGCSTSLLQILQVRQTSRSKALPLGTGMRGIGSCMRERWSPSMAKSRIFELLAVAPPSWKRGSNDESEAADKHEDQDEAESWKASSSPSESGEK